MANNPEELILTVKEEEAKPQGTSKALATTNETGHIKKLAKAIKVIPYLLSIPTLAYAMWLLLMRDSDCENILKLPKLQIGIGIALVLVFIIHNIITFFMPRMPVPGLLMVMVPLIFKLTMGLALVGAYKLESRSMIASPTWISSKVYDVHNWFSIKSCIYDVKICEELVYRFEKIKWYDFDEDKLSPIESGCCRPPTTCDMEYINATYWKKKEPSIDGDIAYDPDCELWKNDMSTLCYDCFSCKRGFISLIQSKWQRLGCFLVVMAILLIVSHSLLFLASIWKWL